MIPLTPKTPVEALIEMVTENPRTRRKINSMPVPDGFTWIQRGEDRVIMPSRIRKQKS